jgi:polar amino acid transport system substrate-binding protein
MPYSTFWLARAKVNTIALLALVALLWQNTVSTFAATPTQALESRAGRPEHEIPAWVRIASEGARPPYNYLEGNDLAGFEIDLAHELCARMKVICTFVVQDWDNLVPGLVARHYDAIMAAFEIGHQIETEISFSKPYVLMPSSLMAAKDREITGTSPSALDGKKIGVVSDTSHENYAKNWFTLSEIVSYGRLDEAILDLAEGRIDFAFGAKDALAEFLKTRREAQCCVLVGDVAYDPTYFGKGIGIALRSDDAKLLAAFDDALAKVRADGSFERIRAKYFDFSLD